ncbi:hypothetical protein OOZ15_19525 [Galbibacter sp. EGI 63066]|uniref:RHS repeat domain-containing protein n=1 Tax=Galbibacter sp. EGI 63066 TaxID=2993559 RepID=UPI002248D13C|nr:RHS repeat-associated core domain-containing protein [Galbibacter sp. EGI 63066]MCX2682146.1 hypothetical protein [Galbibacter sp. EGI 63066]
MRALISTPYDFGARNYDPALGRWMNLDPLANKFPSYSPYVYSINNPVLFIDYDGKEPDPVILKVVVEAIQNAAIAIANRRINQIKQKFNVPFIDNKETLASIPWNEKYRYKSGVWNAISGRNETRFDANINVFGKSFSSEITYQHKSYKSLMDIKDVVVQKGENGKRLVANFFTSGYFVNLNTGKDLTTIYINFVDEKTHTEFEEAFENEIEKEINKLLEANPELKELYDLNSLYSKVERKYIEITSKDGEVTDEEKEIYQHMRDSLEKSIKKWEEQYK